MLGLSDAAWYSLGYLGIFGLSLGTNLIVFVPVPYLLVILLAAVSGQFDLALLVISSAIGATIGKLIVFQSFYSGSRVIKDRARSNLDSFRKVFERYAWFAVFLAAATPVPDDIVYVPLGLARYNRMRFFLALLAGKTIITLMVVYGATYLTNSVIGPLLLGEGESGTLELAIVGITFAAVALAITYIIARIDWKKWIEKHFSDRRKEEG